MSRNKINGRMSMHLSFKEWCELNGRLHTGARSYEEFERNARDYESYLDEQARAEVENSLHAAGIIEDPDVDGGLPG